MLNRYKFSMDFPPESDLRVEKVTTFLDLMQQAFNVTNWRTSRDEVFEVSTGAVSRYLNEEGRIRRSSPGGIVTLGPVENSYPIMISASTGSKEFVWDFMWVDFHATDPMPDLSYFRSCIESCRPTVAEISHSDNLVSLKFGDRAYAQGRKGVKMRPVIINWFHYFNKQMADTFGGMAYCLQTPAYKVEPFCDGILFQLTLEAFNPTSETDLATQRKAMEFLGLPWDFKKEA